MKKSLKQFEKFELKQVQNTTGGNGCSVEACVQGCVPFYDVQLCTFLCTEVYPCP